VDAKPELLFAHNMLSHRYLDNVWAFRYDDAQKMSMRSTELVLSFVKHKGGGITDKRFPMKLRMDVLEELLEHWPEFKPEAKKKNYFGWWGCQQTVTMILMKWVKDQNAPKKGDKDIKETGAGAKDLT